MKTQAFLSSWRPRWPLRLHMLLAFASLLLVPVSKAQLPGHDAIGQSPTPQWVEPIDLEPLMGRRLGAGEPARLVVHDTQILVAVDDVAGRSQRYEQLVYRLDSDSDVDGLSTISFEFDPSFQKLEIHSVQVLRDGEWSDRIARSRSSVAQVEDQLEGQIYDQSLSLFMILDDIGVGDWLRIESSLIGSNPVLGDDWADDVWLVSQAVARRSLRVLSERDVSYRLLGGAPEPVSEGLVAGRREIRWALEAQPDPDLWHSVPWGHSQQPWVQLSTYAGWESVVAWALPVFEVPPSSSAVREIAAGFTERRRERRLLQARDWVQRQVRYFSVSMGEHSHRPHSPDETLGRRYGDCKDKTMLLLALLRELDIESWPVLVNSGWREGLSGFLPSPYAFDHIIVAARLDDKVVWIDPTLTHQGGESLAGITVPNFRLGLEVRPGVDDLSEVPALQLDPGLKTVLYEYRVEENLLRYEVDVTTVFSGADAEVVRRQLDGTSEEELQEGYLEYYQAEHLTVSVREPLSVVDDRERNVIEIGERYAVVSNSDEGLLGFPFVTFDLELGNELSLAGTDRTAPLALNFPRRRRETIRIETPSAWGFVPIEEAVSNQWFDFVATSTIAPDRRSIELEYVLETRSGTVAVADLPEYDRDVTKAWESLGYSLGDAGFGDSSMLGRQRAPLLSALGFGAVFGLAVLAFLVLARVGNRRLLRFWLPGGHGAMPIAGDAPSHDGMRFVDPSTRILLAVIALLLAMVSDLVTIPAGFLPAATSQWVFFLELFYTLFVILLVVIAGLFTIIAQRELLRNLQAFGLRELDPGLTWSTLSWFVPIAFLFVPYRSFWQIVVASAAPRDRSVMVSLLRTWWGFWVLSSLLGAVAVGVMAAGGVGFGQWLETSASIAQFLAGVLLVTLLLVLRALQREAAVQAQRADSLGKELASSPTELSERLYGRASPVVSRPVHPPLPPPPPPIVEA